MFQLFFKKNDAFTSLGDYRRAILVGEIALITILINLIYIILDYINELHETIYIYFVVIFISGIVIILNRKGYNDSAKFILLITLLITVFILGSSNIQDTQTYIFYIPLIIISFTLFEYKQFKRSIIVLILALLFFMLDYITDFSIIPRGSLDPSEVQVLTITNYTIAILATVYIGYFLIRTNFLSEKKLLERQQELNAMTIELQKSQHRYELAIRGSNAGLWDWDILNNTIYHGKKWKEMLGFNSGELQDIDIEKFYSMVHPQDVEHVKTAVEQHLLNKKPFHVEYRIRRKDGTFLWFLDSGKAVFNEKKVPVRMVGSIMDITYRKEAEEKIKKQRDLLEKANAELDRFVYITSHDLKAPLLSIQGLINLAEISEDKEEVTHCLQLMKERVKGLENFISDIINYSRNVRSGIIKEEVNLKNIIKNILNELFYMQNVDKINFVVDVDPELMLLSDEKRLNVILKNLIFNAIKYHNYDQDIPEVIIQAQKLKNHIKINIKDNGEGIRQDAINNIFDMFYRASEKSTGSGLGLYIVKEMTTKLNGSIKVKSTHGKGSVFTLMLPDTD
jgi:PAS domain S-box-containing protein